eukprot:gene12270-25791_t
MIAKKLLVFGGNGFVGQRVCKNAVKLGMEVISINRSGPPHTDQPWRKNVKWVKGDANCLAEWADEIKGASAVVSCIGAFGSNDAMERINGDLNIKLVSSALHSGVERFIYVSTVENNLPDFILKGYFNGKRRAEQAVLDAFPFTGTVLRPGFMYGTRQVGSYSIPLGLVGKPLEILLDNPIGSFMRDTLPGMKAILACPMSVDDVGLVAAAVAGKKVTPDVSGIVNVTEMKTLS